MDKHFFAFSSLPPCYHLHALGRIRFLQSSGERAKDHWIIVVVKTVQTILESEFTLRLSLANLSGNSGLKSSCHFTIFNAWQELNFGVKIQINLEFILMKLCMHGSFKVF